MFYIMSLTSFSQTDAIIEKASMPFAKLVLKITPPVPRRKGWDDNDESCVFHIKFKTEEGRSEVIFVCDLARIDDAARATNIHTP